MAARRSVTLDDLIALSDEIAALARAGVPLESGLRAVARDLPGRLGRMAHRLSERLDQGEALADALEEAGDFPPAYRAVAVAGIKSGRLAAALEGIATTSRRASEIRRLTIASMTYPLILLTVASLVYLYSMAQTIPVILDTVAAFQVEQPYWLRAAWGMAQVLLWLLPVLWLLLLLGVPYWYLSARRAASYFGGKGRRLPVLARLVVAGQLATFSEVLALLVEQEVPLDEAVSLAGDASGSRQLRASADSLAARIRGGELVAEIPAGVPPLLAWMLTSNASSPHLVRVLRRSAATQRRRLSELTLWVGVYLPVFFCTVVGGSATLFYVLLVMAPFYHLMRGLG